MSQKNLVLLQSREINKDWRIELYKLTLSGVLKTLFILLLGVVIDQNDMDERKRKSS
jgi:hypothetical protein